MTSNALKPLAIAVLAASTTGLTGCFSSSSSGGDSGSLSLGITDAPVDSLEEVNISFTSITLNHSNGERIEIELNEEQLAEQPIDLLTLQRGNAASLIADEEVPAGEYEWIRLNVVDNQTFPDMYVVREDNGGTADLAVQSARGLQLSSGFTVPQGGSADFTVDFDLRSAITDPQGQDGYFLRPSLRLVDNSEVGAIEGTVFSNVISNQCNENTSFNGAVYVYEGQNAEPIDYNSKTDKEPLMTAAVEQPESGGELSYRAAFLTEGDYTIGYTCDADDPDADNDLTFTGTRNVTVSANETQTEDFDGSQ